MTMISALLGFCEGNPLVTTGRFPWQRVSNVELCVFLVVSLNNLLNKYSSCRWSATPWSSCHIIVMYDGIGVMIFWYPVISKSLCNSFQDKGYFKYFKTVHQKKAIHITDEHVQVMTRNSKQNGWHFAAIFKCISLNNFKRVLVDI